MPHDQPDLEAEKQIQQALKSTATELDLRSMKLTELPESIGQLEQLRKLGLGREWNKKDENKKSPDHPTRLTWTTHAGVENGHGCGECVQEVGICMIKQGTAQ
ncbi:MAG: hypothetical protein QY332_14295 [Anaerolineales bacterium]|nr:MAG: hypothetical protein QY332_14295 [Anaerolineales bacterium]